ncbi:hypothetical protein CCP1ISM_50008 [Azospirillaceae bacterium]
MSWIVTAIVVAGAAGGAGIEANQSAKSKSAAKTAENIAQGREAGQRELVNTQSEEMKQSGIKGNKQITDASAITPAEQQRSSGFTTKANTPAEQLMTQSGPIAQAVANRIQERVNTPGMDYNVGAINQSIGNPIWASLKKRGITAQPGDVTGGGLGTEQYMQQMVPYLAQGRQQAIGGDIQRGETYGNEANTLSQLYQNLDKDYATALQNRIQQGAISGANLETQANIAGGSSDISGNQAAMQPLNTLYGDAYNNAMASKSGYDAAMLQSYNQILDAITMGAGGMGGSAASSGASQVQNSPYGRQQLTQASTPMGTGSYVSPYATALQQRTNLYGQ